MLKCFKMGVSAHPGIVSGPPLFLRRQQQHRHAIARASMAARIQARTHVYTRPGSESSSSTKPAGTGGADQQTRCSQRKALFCFSCVSRLCISPHMPAAAPSCFVMSTAVFFCLSVHNVGCVATTVEQPAHHFAGTPRSSVRFRKNVPRSQILARPASASNPWKLVSVDH